MSSGADPRRAMHIQTDVVIQPDLRLAGVDTHAHAHLDALGPTPGRERPLRAHRGGDRVARPREGDKERITLGVDLATVVLIERHAQQALMLAKHLGVAAAQPRQQPRRTLDVAEQERDGPARKLRHNAQLRPITAACQGWPPVGSPSLARVSVGASLHPGTTTELDDTEQRTRRVSKTAR